jgi:hypothetical protein
VSKVTFVNNAQCTMIDTLLPLIIQTIGRFAGHLSPKYDTLFQFFLSPKPSEKGAIENSQLLNSYRSYGKYALLGCLDMYTDLCIDNRSALIKDLRYPDLRTNID